MTSISKQTELTYNQTSVFISYLNQAELNIERRQRKDYLFFEFDPTRTNGATPLQQIDIMILQTIQSHINLQVEIYLPQTQEFHMDHFIMELNFQFRVDCHIEDRLISICH